MRQETYTIVGTRYFGNGAQRVVNMTDSGTPVRLIRDPENQFDRNAVQVWIRETHVGYVRSSEAILLALHMDSRGKPEIVGSYTLVGRDLWPGVNVEMDQ